MASLVIDVSFFQGNNIDWDRVKKSDVKGSILRCGQIERGVPSIDSTFERNYREASKNNLHLGAYYTVGGTSFEAIQQEIELFLRQIHGKSFDLPVYIDLEEDGDQSFLKAHTNEIIQMFKDTIEKEQFKLGVYASYDWFKKYIDVERWKSIPLWIAQYNNTMTFTPDYFGMWQYTSKGNIEGIEGYVDLNYLYIDYWKEAIPVTPENVPINTDIAYIDVEYRVHRENTGWTEWVKNGVLAGIKNSGKRIEAVEFRLGDKKGLNLFLHGRPHVENSGWTLFVPENVTCGTTGQSLRLEALQFQLVGEDSNLYSIQYRVYSQDLGTLDWARDSELSGSEGGGLRIEAVQMLVTAKGIDLSLYEVDSFKKFDKKTEKKEEKNNYFTEDEFKCECGCGGDVVQEMKDLANRVREKYGHSLIVTSAFRCDYQNRIDGGIPNSNHKIGHAVDVYSPGRMNSNEVDVIAECIKRCGGGVIRYHQNLFCHMELSNADWSMN